MTVPQPDKPAHPQPKSMAFSAIVGLVIALWLLLLHPFLFGLVGYCLLIQNRLMFPFFGHALLDWF